MIIRAKRYNRLPCIQMRGHYSGVHFPRIVEYRGEHYTEVDECAFGGVEVRKAVEADYAITDPYNQ